MGNKKEKGTEKDEKSKEEIVLVNDEEFLVVGIGASAGGLEALELFFRHLPDVEHLAFVVIQHLDPTYVGMMPELLQRLTSLKVMEAQNGMVVLPKHVYVLPSNKSMTIRKGKLLLFEPTEARGLRLPIDIFFRSLALDKQSKSIGIVLSGMGADGSIGLKSIKEQNGLVLVQEPSTAKFDSMPFNAIDAVLPDIVASPQELPVKLLDYLYFAPLNPNYQGLKNIPISEVEKIILLLRQETGNDFSLYKKNTLLRRIDRRKSVHQIDKMSDYVQLLQQNPQEINILFKELLIGVTSFFRDSDVWEYLRDNVLPNLFESLPDGHILRAWVTGCSSGEEAFSLAIIFKEALEKCKTPRGLTLQIFATDVDADAIEKARKGFFVSNIEADVSPERLSRFFVPENHGYRVKSNIREMIVFAPQNVIKDPPFTKLDIISCRNMLIYMEFELQKKLMLLFNYILNPNGILILGSAESPGNDGRLFKEIHARTKIYERVDYSDITQLTGFPSAYFTSKIQSQKKPQTNKYDNIQQIAEELILKEFAPPCVLVNDHGDILYISGKTEEYLELPAGKANWNIYYMARPGLKQTIPTALSKALQSNQKIVSPYIKIGSGSQAQYVNVVTQKITTNGSINELILMVFDKQKKISELKEVPEKNIDQQSNKRIVELEEELKRSYEELQNTREEMQTSQEELKSTNEELQSTNEELQSTNEELTTSKEEMQSLNEELQTVNAELQSKVNDFKRSSDDMKNLLNSTEIATLFLDKNLNIRRFTDQATRIIKLRNSDMGRPFTDLVSELQYPEIRQDATKVLQSLIPVVRAISTTDKNWYDVRIMPYRTLDDRIDGLVITFSDITESKKLEHALMAANEKLRQKESSSGANNKSADSS